MSSLESRSERASLRAKKSFCPAPRASFSCLAPSASFMNVPASSWTAQICCFMASISRSRSFTACSLSPEPESRAFCSARSLPVSSSRRLRFWSRNESCCFRPAASSWIWERALEAFSRWFLAASRSTPSDVIASFLAVFSASSSSMDARSPAIFLRISRICSSSWRFSRFMSAEDSVSSSFFWFSCRRDSFAVFCSRYRAWREVRTLERLLFFSSRRASWKTSSFWIRSTARRAFLQASSISSISLLRPRRLLEFLKAPPLMEPPGLKRSPSGVTMRME